MYVCVCFLPDEASQEKEIESTKGKATDGHFRLIDEREDRKCSTYRPIGQRNKEEHDLSVWVHQLRGRNDEKMGKKGKEINTAERATIDRSGGVDANTALIFSPNPLER